MPVERGNHCNYNTNELLLVLDGSIFLELEDVVGNKVTLYGNASIFLAEY